MQSEAERHAEDVRQRAAVHEPVKDEGDAQARKSRLQDKFNGVKDSIMGRVPDEHKDRANEHANRAKNFFNDEYFPPERRDQFIYRLKKVHLVHIHLLLSGTLTNPPVAQVIYECQSHDDYQGSMQWLLNFLEEYASHGRTVAGHGKDSHQQLASDPNLKTSLNEIRTLLERFANGRSLSTIGDAMRALYEDSQQDERLRHWFHDVDEYVREVLLQPGYVLDDQCDERGSQLRETGKQFYDDKYKGHFDNLFNSVSAWFGAWAEDPLNKQYVICGPLVHPQHADHEDAFAGSATTSLSSRRTSCSTAMATCSSSLSSGQTFARRSCPGSLSRSATYPSRASSTRTSRSTS